MLHRVRHDPPFQSKPGLPWQLDYPQTLEVNSWSYSHPESKTMNPLTQYGRMAEKHWREFCPRRVAALEAQGMLQQRLQEAEDKTDEELDRIRRQLIQQGLTPSQAHQSAWETVRSRYLLLPPES